MRRSRRESSVALGRRSAVGALGGLAAGLLFARRSLADDGVDPDDLRNLKLLDLTEGGRRFVLVVPRYQNPDTPIPLVVFLHGLGETSNERLGAYAWVE